MLRGINLGPKRRVPMAELRALLTEAGYEQVQTYVQSGNIVLESASKPAVLERELAALIEQRFGFAVPVAIRTRRQLQAVVDNDPIAGGADDPKRYQVTFLANAPDAATLAKLRELSNDDERFAHHGRELYTYHPAGVARSKLALAVVGKPLGAGATARNWTTVCKLLELAGG